MSLEIVGYFIENRIEIYPFHGEWGTTQPGKGQKAVDEFSHALGKALHPGEVTSSIVVKVAGIVFL